MGRWGPGPPHPSGEGVPRSVPFNRAEVAEVRSGCDDGVPGPVGAASSSQRSAPPSAWRVAVAQPAFIERRLKIKSECPVPAAGAWLGP